MALQLDYVTESGIDVKDAYWRIDTFRGDRNTVRLGIGIYKDAQARADGRPPVGFFETTMPTPNTESNMFAAAYVYLKTQTLTYGKGETQETIDLSEAVDV